MDGVPVFHTLLDFLADRPAPHGEGHARQARAGAGRVPAESGGPGAPFVAPVERDRLFFRVVSASLRPGSPDAQGDGPGEWVEKVRRTFIHASTEVWGRLPGADRQVLLDYWQGRPYRSASDGLRFTPPPPGHRPLIQVTDRAPLSPSSPAWSNLGHELNFPAALVLEQPNGLAPVIARALAQVYRFASRRHWRLVLEAVEEPLALWEKQQGNEAGDAARDQKLDALEGEYLRRYEAELRELLGRWGFDQERPRG
jgi:hypothetical protein